MPGPALTPSDYRAALATSGAVVPALFSALGRFPVAMLSLATLLYVQPAYGSYAAAGLVSAGTLVGIAIGSVAQGRVIDRFGATRPLLAVTAVFLVAAAVLAATVAARSPLAVPVAAAVLTGLSTPALPGASRALWSRLLPPGPTRDAAYGYEAISLEVFFILGPALAVLLVTAPWPGTGLATAVVAMAVGTAGFALSASVRTHRVTLGGGAGLLGALAGPGMRTVALAALGFGLVIGSVEVGVPAVTAEFGSVAIGGILLSAWAVTSVLAGVAYSLRPWPEPLQLRIPVLLGGFGALVATMALVGPTASLVVLAVAMLAAGATITPQVTAHSIAVDRVAPAGSATEAFGWVITAATLGIAAGQALGGVAVEAAGPPAAFVAGGLAGMAVAALLWLRRATVAAPGT